MTTQPVAEFLEGPHAKSAEPIAPQQPPATPAQVPARPGNLPVPPKSQGHPGNGGTAPETAQARPKFFWEDHPLTKKNGSEARSAERKLVIVNASKIEPEPVDWLWEGWIAKGFITIFAGETATGKSTALGDVAARVTTGKPWPGESVERRPGQVVWLGSEDPPRQVTIPRLMASGANLEHVNIIAGATLNGRARSVSMQEDLGSMMHALDMAKEQGDPISMIVIDPVTSYLSGGVLKKVDMNDAGQIRTVLEPWSTLASLYNVAIVCVTHFAKDTNRSMLNRVLGSGAFSALSRGVIAITTLPEEAQEGNPHAKAMFLVKCNLPDGAQGAWRFSTQKTTVFNRANRPISTTKVEWDELDHTMTPTNIIGTGKERGPVSKYGAVFPLWLQAQFVPTPPGYGLPVAQVKAQALAAGAASADWWKHHWREHMEQQEMNGILYCRPIPRP